MHVLVDVSQKTSHTLLLSLNQMNAHSVNNQLYSGNWLLNELLEIVVHVACIYKL